MLKSVSHFVISNMMPSSIYLLVLISDFILTLPYKVYKIWIAVTRRMAVNSDTNQDLRPKYEEKFYAIKKCLVAAIHCPHKGRGIMI